MLSRVKVIPVSLSPSHLHNSLMGVHWPLDQVRFPDRPRQALQSPSPDRGVSGAGEGAVPKAERRVPKGSYGPGALLPPAAVGESQVTRGPGLAAPHCLSLRAGHFYMTVCARPPRVFLRPELLSCPFSPSPRASVSSSGSCWKVPSSSRKPSRLSCIPVPPRQGGATPGNFAPIFETALSTSVHLVPVSFPQRPQGGVLPGASLGLGAQPGAGTKRDPGSADE